MTLYIKIHSKPAYDEKYIKTNVKTFNGIINAIFGGNKITKEGIYYTCIAAICIDSAMKINKNNYPQVYLEKCRYEIKKKKCSYLLMLN